MTRKLNQAKLHSLLRQSPSLFFAHLFPKIEYIEDFKGPGCLALIALALIIARLIWLEILYPIRQTHL